MFLNKKKHNLSIDVEGDELNILMDYSFRP